MHVSGFNLKGIVHPKINVVIIFSPSYHSRPVVLLFFLENEKYSSFSYSDKLAIFSDITKQNRFGMT